MQALTTYLDAAPGTRKAFADRVGISSAFLSQIESGARKPAPRVAFKIEKATGGRVTLADLRPDIYGPDAFEAAE